MFDFLNLDLSPVHYRTSVSSRVQTSYNDHNYFLAALIIYRNTVLLCLCRRVVRDPHQGDTNVKRADGCFYELKTACYRQSNGYGLATSE